jgi:hypothetical protein
MSARLYIFLCRHREGPNCNMHGAAGAPRLEL